MWGAGSVSLFLFRRSFLSALSVATHIVATPFAVIVLHIRGIWALASTSTSIFLFNTGATYVPDGNAPRVVGLHVHFFTVYLIFFFSFADSCPFEAQVVDLGDLPHLGVQNNGPFIRAMHVGNSLM